MNRTRWGAVAAVLGMTGAALWSSPVLAGVPTTGPDLVVPSSIPELEPYELDRLVTTDTQWTQDNGTIVLAGDFNADARQDLFFYGAGSKPDQMWLANSSAGERPISAARFTPVARTLSGIYVPFVGDFDGNGADDIFWYAPGKAADSIWYHDTSGAIAASVPVTVTGSYQPIVADFDQNDGVASDDILWYSSSAGESLWSGKGNRTFSSSALGNAPSKAKALVGNFRPDTAITQTSVPDVFFYVPGTGADAIWAFNSAGAKTSLNVTVNGSYQPIVGNFDQGLGSGNGALTDVFWYAPGKPSDSVWINTSTSPSGNPTFFSVTDQVNATTYRPFVVPSEVGPDTIVWNNPSGGDFFWHPQGGKGQWAKVSVPMPYDPGTRTPFVGTFDDDALVNESVRIALAGGTVEASPYYDQEFEPLPGSVDKALVLPRADIFWYGPGNAAGRSELVSVGSPTTLAMRGFETTELN